MPESGARLQLRELVANELAAPLSEPVTAFAAELRRRHGDAVMAVLFYGSCLRKQTTEGVLDFYVIVDDYRSGYESRALALANAVLPPNVFFCEWLRGDEPLRAKYAVLSARDFRRAASPRSIDCRVWARFSQPAALAFVRDEDARREVAEVATSSCLTFTGRAWAARSGEEASRPFTAEALVREGFRETYRAELRTERDDTIQQIFEAQPNRYREMTTLALRTLADRGEFTLKETPEGFEAHAPKGRRRRARLAWQARRPLAKALAIASLLKTAFTFGDWVPYVVWKVERHTAVKIELTERQRRHPLVFAWPVVFRLLREGIYR
ncbi:MAG: hypothetical protein JRH10_12950 [Deltaproteobacteria bacterium]|nr:hypothetical protein [Deltaproteobacteria bacterium]MBW2446803.1 hypothetical protein [Deltaproteobacteria bacterium]